MDVNDANGQRVATYSYDYKGRRIYKTVNGTTTSYCYDGAQVIAEYDANDTLLRKFIYGPGIDEPICMFDVTDSNAVYYYHFDGLGSVAALSDANGAIVEHYSYDVFGEPNTTSGTGNPYMFTGRRYDTETDNYYYRARYYKSDIGRFLQTDTIGYVDGLNLYAYVLNNPVNLTDPTGGCSSKDIPPGIAEILKTLPAWITNKILTKTIGGVTGAACAAQACEQGLSPGTINSYRSGSKCADILGKAGYPWGIAGNAAFYKECRKECVRIAYTDAYKNNCECIW